jgi:hypothetical protein
VQSVRVVGERIREEEVCHGSNRDIPVEIRNFRVVELKTFGFHSILVYKLEFLKN